MAVLYTNNAASNLSASITSTATSFSVTSGQGALFPAITGSDYFYVTLLDNSGNIEIVKVTARSTDTFTVTRAQDGTTARAWSANDKVELRITRSMLDDLKGERMPVYGPSVGSGGSVMINLSGNPSWSDVNFTYDPIMGDFRAIGLRAAMGASAPTWNFNNILHAGNYSSYALPLSGGTLSGQLTAQTVRIAKDSYELTLGYDAPSGGVGAYFNSGSDGVYFYNRSGGANSVLIKRTGGLDVVSGSMAVGTDSGGGNFVQRAINNWGDVLVVYRGGSNVWNLQDSGGAPKFTSSSLSLAGNQVLHAGNYTSYSPSLTGSGASGTWGISISGNAATATSATDSTKLPLSGGALTGNVSFAQGANINFGTSTTEAGPWTISVINSGGATPATKGTGRGRNLIIKAGDSDNGAGLAGGDMFVRGGSPTSPSVVYGDVRIADLGGQVYLRSGEIAIGSGNYTSYSPSLTGSGASGTWGINVTGSAGSVAWSGVTSKPINSALFDVAVTSTSYWTVLAPGGGAISGARVYRISMVTNSTGTDTGEQYLLSNVDNLGWVVKTVIRTGSNSNYPYVFLDAGTPKVKTDHASSYPIRVLVEEFDTGNTGGLITWFGLAGLFSSDLGVPKYRTTWSGTDNTLLHSGNYSSYALPLSGGTLTGNLSFTTLSTAGYNTALYQGNWNGSGYWGLGSDGTHVIKFDQINGLGGAQGFAGASDITLKLGTKTVLDSGNYTSYAAPASHTHAYLPLSGGVVTGPTYFRSNPGSGVYSASTNNPPLQAYSDDTGSAYMSFHRGGYYAVNFGLDPDNVLRIGGWSAASNRWQLDMSGNTTIPGRATEYAWTTSGRNYSNEWIEFPNYTGLYSPNNGATFYPNNGSYGSWRSAGSRNGWSGIEFDASNGQVVLMINPDSNTSGFHNNSYGWQFRWNNGTAYVYKNAYGGGTAATVLDSSNYSNYTDPRYMRYVGTFAGDWQTLTDSAGEVRIDQVNNITSGSHTNYPTGVYTYGSVMSWRGDNHSFQLYSSHTGDLAYKSQWNNDGYTGWQRILTSMNYTSYGDGRYVQKTGDTMTGALSTNVGGTSIFIGAQNVTTSNALRINWHTDGDLSYYIGKRAGTWTQPMDIAFYTGLRYHAHYNYGGHRFYTQGVDSNLAFSVGDGDNDVRLYNNFRLINGTSPYTSYFLWGDSSGWIFRFMTNVSGTATERFRFSDQGAFNAVGAITQNGSQVLHAGNYTSYVPGASGGTYTGTVTISRTTAGDTWNSELTTTTTLADKITSRFTKTNTPPSGIQTNYIGGLAWNGKNYLGNSYEFATIVGSVLSASALASGAYALGQIELNAYYYSSSLALSAGLKIGNSAFAFSGSGGQFLSIQSGGITPTTNGTVSLGNSTQGFGQAYFQSVRLNNGWYENSKLLQFSGSLTANYNAMMAGPVTLDTGYTITIETGATLTIV